MNAKILLVDDEPLQRKASRLYLEDAGYEVESAGCAEEAIRKARESRPDLIVSDVLMGEVDGFGLCRRLRADSELGRVPVVLVSSHYGAADVDVARSVGAEALIERTPTFTSELAAVRSCIGASATRRQPRPTVQNYEQHLRANANQLTKLDERARRADQRWRTLLDEAYDAIAILTPDGEILDANRRWLEILGIPPAEMIGKHVRDFAAPGASDEVGRRFRASIASGANADIVPLLRRTDGAVIHMQFSHRVVELDDGAQVMAIGREVTEQIEATRRLMEAEAMYRSLVERIPDAVWRLRSNGSYAFISPNITALTGLSLDQLYSEGRTAIDRYIHVEDRARVHAMFTEARTSGGSFEVECRFIHPLTRRTLWFQTRARADGSDVLEGLTTDITSRRELEQGLAQAQKLEAIGQLTGGIAHDFNNLLSVILSSASFLLEELVDDDPRRVDAKEIELAAERAAALTRQLLAFSRREAVELVDVEIDRMVTGVGKMLRRLIGENIVFAVDLKADPSMVRGDVGQLEQVLVNLALNARDAMPQGGRLSISTDCIELAAPNASGLAAGRYVRMRVVDTGTGMDEATLRRIFEPFFTTKPHGQGTGLGLATCYGIVRRASGSIAVKSTLGAGTEFSVLLPAIDPATRTTSLARTARLAVCGKETVLVVEDDPHVRRGLARTLTGLGYTVLLAASCDEALAAACKHAIDIVLSDVVLPGHSGPEILEKLRASRPALPVLWMTGYSDHQALRGVGRTEGDFLAKPFSQEVLAQHLRCVLDR